jgi:hypothetical protein
LTLAIAALPSCSGSDSNPNSGVGGNGGATGTGGAKNVGGTSNTGASKSTGGNANGGSSSSGGNANGGSSSSGGNAATGGTNTGTSRTCPDVRPDASNTGVPPGVALAVVNQDVTITQDGTVIDAQDIHGFLVVKASHVTIKRSIVRGGVATANGDGIRLASGTDILIEDVEVALAYPSAYLDGVAGSNFTVRRANIHGGVDGMKLGSNSTVECSYIHDLVTFASDPNQGGGPTHNDAIQILSGSTIRIVNNQLLASIDQNAAIQVTQDFGAVTDLSIDGNWADGGGCTFNFSHNGGTSLALTATNNRFGRNSFYDCPILKSTQTSLTQSGNVWDDDGSPVPTQTHD